MTRPQKNIGTTIKETLEPSQRYLIAVSGGIDSMVLLHAVSSLKAEVGYDFEVAHIDHGLRASSSQDAEFVERTCQSLSVPFNLYRATPPESKTNIEAWGRQERYKFFKNLCSEKKLDWTLTAHNANDVAETLLMRIIANKELNSINRIDSQRLLRRPFLSITRRQIEAYADEHKISYREDETNHDIDFTRNKIRKLLIPYLENEFDPRIVEILSLRAEALADDSLAVTELISPIADRIAQNQFGSKEWRKEAKVEIARLPLPLACQLINALFREKLGFNLGRIHTRALYDLILGTVPGLELPGGFSVRSHGGRLEIVQK